MDPKQQKGADSSDQILLQMLTGAWVTQIVAAAAQLAIPDLLAEGKPMSGADLASRLHADSSSIARLLRTLTAAGICDEKDHTFSLTPVGERLRSGVPGSLRNMFLAETDVVHHRSWDQLVDALKSGKPQPAAVFGMPAFEYYGKHVQEGEQFGRAMQDLSAMSAHAVLGHYDFSAVKRAVDVGGGNGSFVRAILKQHPKLSGVIFDLPYIEQAAHGNIHDDGLGDRCRFEAGDFFKSVSEGGDLYLLRFILHDWNDEESIRVLKSCRAAVQPGGRVLIVEMLMPENNEPGLVQLMDINMLVMTGGRERTAKEYGNLLDASGFKLKRTIATDSPFFIVEGEPV